MYELCRYINEVVEIDQLYYFWVIALPIMPPNILVTPRRDMMCLLMKAISYYLNTIMLKRKVYAMIKTKSIDHVCLWVRSLPEAKAYYEKLFGFTCRVREGDGATLIIESEQVHFFLSENQGSDEFMPKQHISFEVDSLDQVIENLESLGISDYEVGKITLFTHRNYKWCEWRDPSGIRLECVEVI